MVLSCSEAPISFHKHFVSRINSLLFNFLTKAFGLYESVLKDHTIYKTALLFHNDKATIGSFGFFVCLVGWLIFLFVFVLFCFFLISDVGRT